MENLKHVLDVALGHLSKGEAVPEGMWKMLTRGYGSALSKSPCPCRAGETDGERIAHLLVFEDCCKQDWIAVERGQKSLAREKQEHKKQEKKANEEEVVGEDFEDKDVEWVVKLGIHKSDNGPVLQPYVKWNPFQLAGFILTAYHDLYTQTVSQLIGTTQQVVQQLAMKVGGPNMGSMPMMRPRKR